MSDPSTPRRSKRSRDAQSSPPSKPSTPSRKGTRSGRNTPVSTPTRRSTRGKDDVPSSQQDITSPPSQKRKVDTSDLDPMPSSPHLGSRTEALFSSPPPPRSMGGVQATSEIDLSSPLNYGTPSSRLGLGTPRTPGAGGTPIRPRPDVRSERKMRTVNVGSSETDPARMTSEISSDPNAGPQLVIWGTDVVVNTCKEKFRRFVMTYIDPDANCDEDQDGINPDEPLYLQRLEEINMIGEPFLNFSASHLKQFDANLYRQLICYPQEVIPTFDMAVNELFFEKYPDTMLEHQIQVRPHDVEKTSNMRSLNPEDIDQLITISGMVIRTSGLMPEMREAFFQCHVCKNSVTVELERGRIVEPTLCQNCNTNHSYQLVHNRSQFTDKQMVKLQEAPEDMPAGQTPHTVMVFAHGDLVDKVQPGDRVTVTGIYRATPLRVNPRMRNVKSVYKTSIDVVHYQKRDSRRLHEIVEDDEGSTCRLSEERVKELKALSTRPSLYLDLATAIAPSIYENVDIKKGILLQLFGGARKDFTNTGRGRFRSDINILLCGDPGTSKSQLLQYVYNLVPRAQYTSGRGSSAVGLTAYVTKDPETGQLILQTGALVLADNGVCCIDEFDKMSESTRSVLHEVMEQQTLSIAKAGIICSLNARTSLLAAANPIESQWNKNKTIIDNIQLPHTLLSRFDLIFLILDPQDELYDRRLANHLVSLYYITQEQQQQEFLDMSLLRDYIGYAKTHVHPKISEKAAQAFIEAYVEARKMGSGRGQVSAYPRQLESLIRLAEAHARMRLSNWVEVSDVQEARRLHREALKQAAIDPATGKIDISILTTGISGAARKQRAERAQLVKELIQAKGKQPSFKYTKLFEEFREKMMERGEKYPSRDMFDDAVQDLEDDGVLIRTGSLIRACT